MCSEICGFQAIRTSSRASLASNERRKVNEIVIPRAMIYLCSSVSHPLAILFIYDLVLTLKHHKILQLFPYGLLLSNICPARFKHHNPTHVRVVSLLFNAIIYVNELVCHLG